MKILRCFSWILSFALAFQLLAGPVRAEEATETTAGTTASTEPAGTVEVTVPETPENVGDYTGQDASITAGSRTIEAGSSLHGDGKLLPTAQAALLFEITSGSMVYAYNPDMEIEPSSFTKIMTAMLAVEHGGFDEIVTVKQSVLDTVSSTDERMRPLEDGEELPFIDLIYCMMTGSSNNAAAVIAEHVAGSQEAFVEMMNQRAAELGCTNTHFTNPHGIPEEGMVTTCRDFARIIMAAIQNETFCEVFADDYYYVEVTNMGDYRGLYSLNYMVGMLSYDVYYDYRVTGGRTATTSDDRSSFAATFESGDLSYVSIVYGADPHEMDDDGYEVAGSHHVFLETQELIDIGCEGYSIKQVLRPGQITSHFSVTNGSNDVVAGPTTEIVTLIPNGVTLEDLALRYQKTNGALNAPVKKGEVIDTMTVWYGNVCIAQSEIVTMNSAKVSLSGDDASGNGGDGIGVGLTIFLVIVGLIVGAAGVLYVIRFVRTGIARSRRRRRRASRRRS